MDDSSSNNMDWPLPKFNFLVSFEGVECAFQEASGLGAESKPIHYSEGGGSTVRHLDRKNSSNVTMKKGVIAKDNAFWDWFSEIKMNTIKPKTITIKLLDHSGNPTLTWILNNAFPIKVESAGLNSDSNEVAIERIEIAYEWLTMANG